jgi:signal transduction histidine kinase/ligand-binding sensor domain-containing protein
VVLALALWWPARTARALDADKPLGRCSLQGWHIKDGLPSESVRALAQTADGRLWAATVGGLARFDGRRWTNVEVPSALRAAAAEINHVRAQPSGAVWLGSGHRGPLLYDEGVVRGFTPDDGLATTISEVRAFAANGGEVWMATADQVFRVAEGRFVAHALGGLAGTQITALTIDDRGSVWVGTSRGAFTLVGSELAPAPQLPAGAPVTAIYEDRRKVLWVAAGDSLFALDGAHATTFSRADGLPPAPIAALADDAEGNLWIATPRGLGRLQQRRFTLFTSKDGLPDDEVTAVLVDREGTLWVGTRNSGLVQLTDRTLDTHQVPPVLEGATVESVAQADDGALWVGTREGGAIRLGAGAVTVYSSRDGLTGEVFCVLPAQAGDDGGGAPADAHGGSVWLGTSHGLLRFRAGRIEAAGLWRDRFVVGLYRDRQGALWIGGNGELGRLVGGRLTVFGAAQGLPDGQVRAVAEDPDGALWVSAVRGLVRFDERAGRFGKPGFAVAARFGGVRSMLAGRDGSFWLATIGMGLGRLAHGQLQLFGAGAGLEDMLYQVLEDDAGDLWIGAHNKILRVSPASLQAVAEGRRDSAAVMSFDTTDRRTGVSATKVRQPAAWKARDGRLWFATEQGMVTIDPRHVRPNTIPVRVEIEGATVDGRTVTGGADAHFPAGAGQAEIRYGAVTLLEPNRVRYRYRLEGHDRTWIEAGARRVASYGGLAAGAYRLHLQAANNDGLWSEHGPSLRFTIAAPFYRSLWFFGLCGVGMLGLVALGHRARLSRLRAEYAVLFGERSRMARELHDTLLQGMSAVTVQLNAIRLELVDAPEETKQELSLMQETVTKCLEDTRQTVWQLRDRGRQGGDLGPALGRMARRLADAAGGCAVDVAVTGPPFALPHAVEDELFRIGQEAVTNALKHASPSRLSLEVRYEGDVLVLRVADDGVGFDAAASADAAAGHFGLLGLRERATRARATLNIRSRPGGGTVVEARVSRSS